MACNVLIRLRGAAGKTKMISMDPQSTVHAVKSHTARRWLIPAACQQLYIGNVVLDNKATLAELYDHVELDKTGGTALSMTLIVPLKNVLRGVACSSRSEREDGLDVLRWIVPRGDKRAVAAIPALLANTDPGVRRTALEALACVAYPGDNAAIDAANGLLRDRNEAVRVEALKTLYELVPEGNELTIVNLSRCLEQCSWLPPTKMLGLETLTKVARRGDSKAFCTVSLLLEDLDESVRQAALKALLRLVPEDNKQAAAAAVRIRLEHRDEGVRQSALKGLTQVCPRSDESTISALIDRLANWDPEVTKIMLLSLTRVAQKGDTRTCEAIISCLQHEDLDVRRTALHALVSVAQKGDTRVIAAVQAQLDTADTGIRELATKALAELAPRTVPRRIRSAVRASTFPETTVLKKPPIQTPREGTSSWPLERPICKRPVSPFTDSSGATSRRGNSQVARLRRIGSRGRSPMRSLSPMRLTDSKLRPTGDMNSNLAAIAGG